MSDRIRALVESNDWLMPPFPTDLRRRRGGADAFVLRSRGQLSPKARKAIRTAAHDSADAMIEAAGEAVGMYKFDCAMDWSHREATKNAQKHRRMIKRLEQWAKPLSAWLKKDDGFKTTDEENFCLDHHQFPDLEEMRDLRRLANRFVSAVDAGVEDLKESGRDDRGHRGPVRDMELRRLVYRLGMAWEMLTDDRIDSHPENLRIQVQHKTKNQPAKSVLIEWAFLDVVAAVFESVKDAPTSDLNGVRIVSELVEHHRDTRK